VADDEPFVLNDLVEDLEALRLELHVARWTPIAHSFAGLIAMRYALAHPTSVDKLVFDDPTFDIAASDRAMLEMLAEGYDRAGMPDPAAEARAAALRPMTPRECWQTFSRMGAALGTARRLDLYAHSLAPGYFFQWMRDSGLPEENWLRGSGPSQQTLWKDETVFESLVPRLHELRAPMLLLKGRYDFNTSQDQLDAFKALPNGRVVTFENSAHLPWAEEPDRFADVIRRFVHGK
jgi:proline iminopeptidase